MSFDVRSSQVTASTVFSSFVPRRVELDTDTQAFSEGFYETFIKFGGQTTNLDPSSSFVSQPYLLLRPLEIFSFRGTRAPFIPSETVFSVPFVSNLDAPVRVFDSLVSFQTNRVTLQSALAGPASFEQFELDFSSLATPWTTPAVLHCVSSDALGTCLRCANGFSLSPVASLCEPCSGLFLPVLRMCLANANTQTSQSHKLVSGTAQVKEKITSTGSTAMDVQFYSFFEGLGATIPNALSESLTTSGPLASVLRLRLDFQSVKSIETLLVPGRIFVQLSGYSYLMERVTEAVQISPNHLRIEATLVYYPTAAANTSNYILPVSNADSFAANGITTVLEAEVSTIDLEKTVQDLFDSGNGFLPIEFKSDKLYLSPHGPFHDVNEGPVSQQVGFESYKKNGLGINAKRPCDQGCLACNAQDPCVSCRKSFFMDPLTGSCRPCSPECAECSLHPELCLSCSDPQIVADPGKSASQPTPNLQPICSTATVTRAARHPASFASPECARSVSPDFTQTVSAAWRARLTSISTLRSKRAGRVLETAKPVLTPETVLSAPMDSDSTQT